MANEKTILEVKINVEEGTSSNTQPPDRPSTEAPTLEQATRRQQTSSEAPPDFSAYNPPEPPETPFQQVEMVPVSAPDVAPVQSSTSAEPIENQKSYDDYLNSMIASELNVRDKFGQKFDDNAINETITQLNSIMGHRGRSADVPADPRSAIRPETQQLIEAHQQKHAPVSPVSSENAAPEPVKSDRPSNWDSRWTPEQYQAVGMRVPDSAYLSEPRPVVSTNSSSEGEAPVAPPSSTNPDRPAPPPSDPPNPIEPVSIDPSPVSPIFDSETKEADLEAIREKLRSGQQEANKAVEARDTFEESKGGSLGGLVKNATAFGFQQAGPVGAAAGLVGGLNGVELMFEGILRGTNRLVDIVVEPFQSMISEGIEPTISSYAKMVPVLKQVVDTFEAVDKRFQRDMNVYGKVNPFLNAQTTRLEFQSSIQDWRRSEEEVSAYQGSKPQEVIKALGTLSTNIAVLDYSLAGMENLAEAMGDSFRGNKNLRELLSERQNTNFQWNNASKDLEAGLSRLLYTITNPISKTLTDIFAVLVETSKPVIAAAQKTAGFTPIILSILSNWKRDADTLMPFAKRWLGMKEQEANEDLNQMDDLQKIFYDEKDQNDAQDPNRRDRRRGWQIPLQNPLGQPPKK